MTAGIRKRREASVRYDAALASWHAASWHVLDAALPPLCGDCRHWGGEPDNAKLGPCHVAGSFRAPGGLFTEADFGCVHGVRP